MKILTLDSGAECVVTGEWSVVTGKWHVRTRYDSPYAIRATSAYGIHT